MRITVDEAREYFAHASQQEHGLTEKDLPDWFDYLAKDGVCVAFHAAVIPGVWFAHVGANPRVWGATAGPVRQLLTAFRDEVGAVRIVAWVDEKKRHAISLAKRAGAVVDGEMNLPSGRVVMLGWE